MENTGKTTVGVSMRPHERLAIKLSKHRLFKHLGCLVANRLCERCLKSGNCVEDVYKGCWYIPKEELGCPGWCELLAYLETKAKAEVEVSKTDFNNIPF